MRGFSNLRKEWAATHASETDLTQQIACIDGVLTLRVQQRSDKDPHIRIDLKECWLPPTLWAPHGMRLADREDLVEAIASAVRVYIVRAGESKSTGLVVRSIVTALAKVFEYGWLNHCYRTSDWSCDVANRLLGKLVDGGWAAALQLDERVNVWMEQATIDEIDALVNGSGRLAEERLRECLKTNCSTREFDQIYEKVLRTRTRRTTKARKNAATSSRGMSASLLRQTMSWINLLADIPSGGLQFTPFENIFRTAHKLGRPLGRTGNISPGEVGKLLAESFAWVYEHSAPIVALLDEMADALGPDSVGMARQTIQEVAERSQSRLAIEAALGMKVVCSKGRVVSVPTVTHQELAHATFDACFLVIAFMNARRADEIQHQLFGIHYDALSVFDERLNLYTCEFYFEKYRKGYGRRFVNQCTVDAVIVLKRLSDVAVKVRKAFRLQNTGEGSAPRERKISQAPQLTLTRLAAPSWFSFTATTNGKSRLIFDRAFGDKTNWALRPHMLRRAYALIHHYRYEDADLLALSQQLDHSGIYSTTVYLTDASVPDSRVPLEMYGRLTAQEKKMMELEQRSVQLELEAVHREKLFNFVEAVIGATDKSSGGFSRLIRKYHARLALRVDYSRLEQKRQAEKLTESILVRGHKLRPFRHGDCGAADVAGRRGLGACYDDEVGRLNRAHAEPIVCHKCPYHRATTGHLTGLRAELTRMETHLALVGPGTLMAKTQEREVENLKVVIRYHESVIGRSDGAAS